MRTLIVVEHKGIIDAIRNNFSETPGVDYIAWGQCPAIGPFDVILVPRPVPSWMDSDARREEMTRWQREWLPTRLIPGGAGRIYHI